MIKRIGCVAAIPLVLIVVGEAAQDSRIAAEIARLRTEAIAVVPKADQAGLFTRLDRADAALSAARRYLALYELQGAFEFVSGHALASREKEFPNQAAFHQKWKEMGAPPPPAGTKAPILFVEALAQSAEGRASATYFASLPYAEDAQMMAGLYYLGESHAMAKFGALARSFELPAAAAIKPNLQSVDAHLTVYEKEVVKAYGSASDAARPRYPGIHVAIKISRTLVDQKRYEGALLQYLVSRYRFAVARSMGATEPAADAVSQRITAVKLPTGADHSIGEFLLQLAAATNAGADPGPRGAAAILDDVLPAYLAVVKP